MPSTPPWPAPRPQDDLTSQMSQLWVDELQRLPSTNHRIGVHAPPTPLPQPPQFPAQQLQQLQQRPFDSYLYFGGDYQTPAHGTPQMSFSELGTVPSVPNLTSVPSMPNMPNMSNLPNVLNIPNMASPLAPMQSLQSLQSLQTLQNLQTLMSNGGNGLAFEPYPPTPDSFRTPAGTEFRSVPMTRHPSGSARPPYPPQLPLSAQSTGQTYYYDRFDRWPQTPQRGRGRFLNGSHRGRYGGSANGNSNNNGNGGGASQTDIAHLGLQHLVYPPTPSSGYLLPQLGEPHLAFDLRQYDSFVRSGRLDNFRRMRNTRMELSDILGHIVEFASDQHGSRFIQNKLENASDEEREAVFDEIMPSAFQLMTDVFGNYVIQKLFEHGDVEQKAALAKTMETHVMQLSMQMYGCRVVQKALEYVLEHRDKLIAELAPHVIECVKSHNANHVIQRLVALDPPAEIINAFKGHVLELSCHPFGCRVLQKLLEILPPTKTRTLLDEMHASAAQLMLDQFGNYVVQSVITDAPGRQDDCDRVIAVIKPRIFELSRHKFASNVVEKAIKFSNPADRRELISELIGEHTTSPETRVATLLRDAYGNFPVQTALAAADADQRDKILSILIPLMPDIRQTPCGRRLDAKIAEYEARSLVPMPIPPLSHSLSSSSVNLPDLANDSDAEAGTPVGAVASLAGITVAAITPVASPVSKGNGKNNKKDNGGLRRVVTLPSDEDDLKTLLP